MTAVAKIKSKNMNEICPEYKKVLLKLNFLNGLLLKILFPSKL